MNQNRSLDHRYRVNIEIGMRVVIEEEQTSELVPCHIKNIVTNAAKHESGIMVECENGRKGRVKYIGTESSFMSPMELITNLEKKLRQLIAEELAKDDPNWWINKINPTIRQHAEEKHSKNFTKKKILQIPNYEMIEETDFPELLAIMTATKNWKSNFEQIFHDEKALFVKLDELAPYRNLPAHSKDVTPHIEKKIQVYYDDIIHLIEEYQRNKTN